MGPKKTSEPPAVSMLIERAKNELESMIDLHPQGMFLISGDGVILRVNRAFLDIMGLNSFPEALGQTMSALISPKTSKEVIEALDRIQASVSSSGKKYSSNEVPVTLKNGRRRGLRFTTVSSGPNHPFHIGIIEDVTGHEAASQTRDKLLKMQAAEEVVGALMHSINQPLTVITLRAQLLLMTAREEQGADPEIMSGLEEIVALTLSVAETLQKAQTFRDFVTLPYTSSQKIVDLSHST